MFKKISNHKKMWLEIKKNNILKIIDKYIFNMDNEIEKKLSIIVENSELGFYDEAFANPVELFSNLMGKQKESMEEVLVKFFSNKLLIVVVTKIDSENKANLDVKVFKTSKNLG